ncbi:MAG TPA: TonB-dependent receptor [Nitrospirota bacterium]|nr:TonB-dependent receptor [Nitrospirota bacterium]
MILVQRRWWVLLLVLPGIYFLDTASLWGGDPDITVTATRIEESVFHVPQSVSLIQSEEILEGNFRTTPESLQEAPGILVQETAYGHGSPFIRGLTGKHILILVDGIRFNNSTFRFGPNQYLNNIDPYIIERVEVMRGPASVLYGSDAIGGVINLITKRREDFSPEKDVDGMFTGRYGSADESKIGRIEVNGILRNLGFVGGMTYKDIGDLRGGADTGIQEHTGYQENDGDIKLQYRLSPEGELIAGYRSVHQSDVPRTDKFVYNDESFVYDPQIWNAFFAAYDNTHPGSLIQGLRVTISRNQEVEGLERRAFGSTTLRRYRDEVDSWGASLQANSLAGISHVLTYGAEYYNDNVDSSRRDINLSTGVSTPRSGNFPDDSEYALAGVFIQDDIAATDRLTTIAGIRYSYARVEATLPSPFGRLEDSYRDWTGSLGFVYAMSEHLHGTASISQGFRAPNLDDTVVLEKVTNEGIDVPSPDLNPENSLNYEIGIKAEYPRYRGSLFYFYNDLHDLIERGPGTYNGQTFIDENSNGIEEPGEAVRQKFNVGRAYIQGAEAEGEYPFAGAWVLRANLSWIYGKDLENREPLSRIPPVMGLLGLRWNDSLKKYWAEYYTRFAGRQDRLSARDLSDPRMDPAGTSGWVTQNLRGGVDFRRWGRLSAAIENILDADYRVHGSGINASGLNLSASYSLEF